MLIGSMNNPQNNILKEVKWVARNFDFLDLTLELPNAHPDKINVKAIRALIDKKKLLVVGHTAWYLPIGSPFPEMRAYALQELEKCACVFEELGVEKMNVHFDSSIFILKDKHIIDFDVWSLRKLVKIGSKHSLDIMAENTPGLFSQPVVLESIFKKVPRLLLHLDIAHANIGKSQILPLTRKFSKRLAHIHVCDNNGKHDEHLPLGRGSINWSLVLSTIKKSGYDGTITLEVFTSTKERLADKLKLRKMWDKL